MTLGLRDLFAAKITIGDDGSETYATPKRLAKAISAELSVEKAEATLFADDAVDETFSEFTKGALKLNVNDISNADAAELLGQEMDADKVLYAGEADDPPYWAIGFRAKKSGGRYKYVWLYKAKFKIPNEKYETKGDGITIGTPEIEAEFIKRDKDGRWKADYVGTPDDAVASKWFTAVREPVAETPTNTPEPAPGA